MKHIPTQLILMPFLLVAPAMAQAQYGDAATPASITYEWLGTPRAPADSVVTGVMTMDTRKRETRIPLLLQSDPQKITVTPVYDILHVDRGPAGQAIAVTYGNIAYEYLLVQGETAKTWTLEVSIVQNVTNDNFRYKKLRLATAVAEDNALYKAFLCLLWDATHMPKPVATLRT